MENRGGALVAFARVGRRCYHPRLVAAPGPSCARVILVALAALVVVAPADAAPRLGAKQAEARRVLAQIQSIDASLDHAVDAYNRAQMQLDAIQADQRQNRRRLAIARSNFSRAQSTLEQRLLALYTTGDATVVEVLLGSETLDELLDRIETVNRVSAEDARVIREIRTFRAEIRRREKELARARAKQERVVAERAERRRAIERQLAERQRLLASIKDEIARIQAAEAARQRRLEAQARARLADQAAAGAEAAVPVAATPPGLPESGAVPPSRYGGVVGIAMQFLGTPYKWGGASPETGFDCSGFIMYVFAQIGVSLPHNAAAQYGYGTAVSRSQLQPGDLVFFDGLGHNGIYIGGGQFIHAPHTGDVVKISTISGWYSDRWVGARRL